MKRNGADLFYLKIYMYMYGLDKFSFEMPPVLTIFVYLFFLKDICILRIGQFKVRAYRHIEVKKISIILLFLIKDQAFFIPKIPKLLLDL